MRRFNISSVNVAFAVASGGPQPGGAALKVTMR